MKVFVLGSHAWVGVVLSVQESFNLSRGRDAFGRDVVKSHTLSLRVWIGENTRAQLSNASQKEKNGVVRVRYVSCYPCSTLAKGVEARGQVVNPARVAPSQALALAPTRF